ncbi:methylmalonyl Co-A mutase-associated GTPase MeaB [Rhodococcus pseudokoreensis]|uniref:Methylmalonyl Co-A mutase-associated GTPase MeaB n=1 Tax=Rhodococcus pseudokoreensis TaxID=2811421 RepID=A0A974W6I5_9NOCA|nr:methylmalonyl Co-A mutase-associated GTPase MeaB [Rhodococcus pseudokoreensis]QSE92100.1 methylmalonyl Co-A mutase-associated GTPase MeaB [Rhodococcus pseudokoreensis]
MRTFTSAEVDAMVSRLHYRDRRNLAHILSLIDSGTPDVRRRVAAGALRPQGAAHILGVTGPPGAGKSSLIGTLCMRFRESGKTVAVLAIDPSSPFSGGAVLGDSLRMQQQFLDPGVFIRSMAARKQLGGLSAVAGQAIRVLDAAGFDIVVIETAGVGQSEVEIATTADTTLVVMAPGMGDSVQATKAGILEIADIFVVNKSDHPGAGRLLSELRSISTMADDPGAWVTGIIATNSSNGEGSERLAAEIERHRTHLENTGAGSARRNSRIAATVREIALAELRRRYSSATTESQVLDELARAVAERRLDPYTAAEELIGPGNSSHALAALTP